MLTNKWIFTIYASIYRIACPNRYKNKEKANEFSGDSSTNDIIRQSTVYEPVDDNAGYQELGHISGPSQYDEIQADYLDPCSI